MNILTKTIIPCLDVTDGKVVKGVKFQNLEGVGYPPEMAEGYEKQGADEIVFSLISASLEARKTLLEAVVKNGKPPFCTIDRRRWHNDPRRYAFRAQSWRR